MATTRPSLGRRPDHLPLRETFRDADGEARLGAVKGVNG